MNIPGAFLLGQLWWYGATVLRPAQLFKNLGWYPDNSLGQRPHPRPGRGLGKLYSRRRTGPVLLKGRPRDYDLVEEFDGLAEIYVNATQPFAGPVFEETIQALTPYVDRRSRILDTSCGPGIDLCNLAPLVPDGEVVGADLAAEMVKRAAASAREKGLKNVAFYQADVAALPAHFTGRFDVVYCSLSFHHYPDPLAALKAMRRVLRKGGHAFITDAGPSWMKMLGSPIAKLADPGWVAFRTGEEFQELCSQAGFSGFFWTELLPGMGLTIATR
jgi:SAM-dependent methyltransferase